MNESKPMCPRCRYDLSGHVRAWEHGLEARATEPHGLEGRAAGANAAGVSCPLEGVCPECGLGFWWREVMLPEYGVPRWSFEHAPRGRWGVRLVRAWVQTAARVFWPRALLGRLSMQHPIMVGRLVSFAAVAAMIAVLSFNLAAAVVAFQQALQPPPWQSLPPPLEAAAEAAFRPFTFWNWRFRGAVPPWLPGVLTMTFVMPLTFLLLPETLRRARVRRGHLWRLGAYASAGAAAAWLVWFSALVVRSWWNGPLDGTPAEDLARWLIRNKAAVAVGWLLWFGAYWWYGIRRYLRLEHPLGVLLAMLTISLLLGAAGQLLAVFLTGEYIFVIGRGWGR